MTEPNRSGRLRTGIVLWAIGAAASLSLLAAPLELLQPPGLDLPAMAFRALSLVNPLIVLSIAVALGAWLSPGLGLEAPLLRATMGRTGSMARIARRQVAAALAVAVPTAAILYAYALYSADWAAAGDMPDIDFPLVTRLAYGGIVEELMTRYGLMTLFVWIGWRLVRRPARVPPAVYAGAASLAALIFAAGHLPLLFAAMAQPTATMVAVVIVGNTVPGFLFGLLYWRRGLESAMMAHALGHLLFWLIA